MPDSKFKYDLTLIETGGTMLSIKDEGLIYPAYSAEHFMYAMLLEEFASDFKPDQTDKIHAHLQKSLKILRAVDQSNLDDLVARYYRSNIDPTSLEVLQKIHGRINTRKISKLDSIDLDIDRGLTSRISEELQESIKESEVSLVLGGSETLPKYSSVSTKKLGRSIFHKFEDIEKLLYELSKLGTVAFTKAMTPFCEDLENPVPLTSKVIGRIGLIASNLHNMDLPPALKELNLKTYIISTTDPFGEIFKIMSPISKIAKVSGKSSNPYACDCIIGTVDMRSNEKPIHERFQLNPQYYPPSFPEIFHQRKVKGYRSKTALPIEVGTDLTSTVRGLDCYLQKKPAFDSVIVEFDENKILNASEEVFQAFIKQIEAHTKRGTDFYLVNIYENRS